MSWILINERNKIRLPQTKYFFFCESRATSHAQSYSRITKQMHTVTEVVITTSDKFSHTVCVNGSHIGCAQKVSLSKQVCADIPIYLMTKLRAMVSRLIQSHCVNNVEYREVTVSILSCLW